MAINFSVYCLYLWRLCYKVYTSNGNNMYHSGIYVQLAPVIRHYDQDRKTQSSSFRAGDGSHDIKFGLAWRLLPKVYILSQQTASYWELTLSYIAYIHKIKTKTYPYIHINYKKNCCN